MPLLAIGKDAAGQRVERLAIAPITNATSWQQGEGSARNHP